MISLLFLKRQRRPRRGFRRGPASKTVSQNVKAMFKHYGETQRTRHEGRLGRKGRRPIVNRACSGLAPAGQESKTCLDRLTNTQPSAPANAGELTYSYGQSVYLVHSNPHNKDSDDLAVVPTSWLSFGTQWSMAHTNTQRDILRSEGGGATAESDALEGTPPMR